MAKKEKICPLMTRATYGNVECAKEDCMLWITSYTTEQKAYQCCAFNCMAFKMGKD